MSEDGCKFCQSAISRATSLHATGGWIDKWEQDVTNVTYYEKLEGRDYNRVTVVVDYGPMTSHPEMEDQPRHPLQIKREASTLA